MWKKNMLCLAHAVFSNIYTVTQLWNNMLLFFKLSKHFSVSCSCTIIPHLSFDRSWRQQHMPSAVGLISKGQLKAWVPTDSLWRRGAWCSPFGAWRPRLMVLNQTLESGTRVAWLHVWPKGQLGYLTMSQREPNTSGNSLSLDTGR